MPDVRRRWLRHFAVLAGGVSLALAFGAALPDAVAAMPVLDGAASSAGVWGAAREVAGALNTGGGAQVNSVSCVSAGNCTAGGNYSTPSDGHAFVVSEVHGTWGTPQTVREPAGESDFAITSVSCVSAGSCSAGGYYTVSDSRRAFVVDEVNGAWGTAEEVPGLGKLDTGAGLLTSVSCASAGSCSAGGFYADTSGHVQGFVVSEVHGAWRAAEEVPGLGKLNAGENAEAQRVSCASAGNCGADGYYTDTSGHVQAFVVDEVNGTWHVAEEVPGTAALNSGGDATANAMSCTSAGNCSDGGGYAGKSGHVQAFVVSEVNGSWGKAEEVRGIGALNTGGNAGVSAVSCASRGNCSAVGAYTVKSAAPSAPIHGFVVTEVNGAWGTAEKIPGAAALGTVSCASAGNCSAGGFSAVQTVHAQAVVVSEVSGTWGAAEEVPGMGKLNTGLGAQVISVSCASAAHCSAGGFYLDSSHHQQAFVVNET